LQAELDIVLPCYNPNRDWQVGLLDFQNKIKKEIQIRYIIVNDGSTNHNFQKGIDLLKKEGVNVLEISYPENRGKGYALRKGINASTSQLIVYTDVDFPFTVESMRNIINLGLENKYDVLAGSRDTSYYQNTMSFFRKLLSKTFRFILKNVLRIPISDTQCGLKAFNLRGKEEFLNTKIERYLFDFEFIYRISKKKSLSIIAVPVQLKPNIEFSKMKPRILFQETLNLFKVILSI